MPTRGEARARASERLRRAGVPTPALDADVLVAHVLGVPKEALVAHPDVSRAALAVARANAEAHGVRIDFREGDLLAPLAERVDIVAANLPYLRDTDLERLAGERTSLAFEPRVATVAGSDGLALVRRAIADLPRVLAADGAAFIECDPPQVAAIVALLSPLGPVEVSRDLARLALCTAPRR